MLKTTIVENDLQVTSHMVHIKKKNIFVIKMQNSFSETFPILSYEIIMANDQ